MQDLIILSLDQKGRREDMDNARWHQDVWVITSSVLTGCVVFVTLVYCMYCCLRAAEPGQGAARYRDWGSNRSGTSNNRWWWWSPRYGVISVVYPAAAPPPVPVPAPGAMHAVTVYPEAAPPYTAYAAQPPAPAAPPPPPPPPQQQQPPTGGAKQEDTTTAAGKKK
ncbi:Exodeoxyribonuclease 7 large subunit [Frankliniella fusca]|uniref:Exodeoxyribonuclease 7 large subunit n=1 Tax=Frankliniella fusca TaxID=407009 RepID=A0AAE1GXS2_9NEOP|nr:Exodeoxyribonuclease 7 large subunit [Frankliniella fusca]